MNFENNFKDTSNILDSVEKNLNSQPDYKIISNLMSDLNKNLSEYRYFVNNQNGNELQLNKNNIKNFLMRIKDLENIIKSKLLITKKYSEYLNF